ncbi:probable insulin-like peptide 6 [Drosophila kikkawai]|uniref:Probable insulin-like peptide 6 n=1 Tax=Drosophila kikkawai TaxID=30033 RepID=A0A6P4HNP7_DROKI|nr:probable insulin-like peptide 6 [Drosophila kikkawai]KAH8342962.1 hypothetical protein KR059_002292 [Drosophila kikkawai]
MIPAVPTSRLLLLLTTIIAVLALMGSCWVPQVGAIPVTSPDADDQEARHICSTNLGDLIQQMCEGRTNSYRDLYPNSFGKRRKRESLEIADRCCKSSCNYREILQFCAQ